MTARILLSALLVLGVCLSGCATTQSSGSASSAMPSNGTDARVVERVQLARSTKGLGPAPLLQGAAIRDALDLWRSAVESGTDPATAVGALTARVKEAHPGRIHPWMWDKTDIDAFVVPEGLLGSPGRAFVAAAAKLPRDSRLPEKYAVVILSEAAE